MEPINYKLAKRVIRQCRTVYPRGLSLREMYLRNVCNKSQDEIKVVVEQLVKMRSLEAIHITGKVGRPTTRYHLTAIIKKMKLFIWHCLEQSGKQENYGVIAETLVEAQFILEWWYAERGYSTESVKWDITEFEYGDLINEPFTLIV